jgi:hypothetical protein
MDSSDLIIAQLPKPIHSLVTDDRCVIAGGVDLAIGAIKD